MVDVVVVLSGDYKKEELLESARSGNEEKMMSILTPLNVNSHAGDGRKVRSASLSQSHHLHRNCDLIQLSGTTRERRSDRTGLFMTLSCFHNLPVKLLGSTCYM